MIGDNGGLSNFLPQRRWGMRIVILILATIVWLMGVWDVQTQAADRQVMLMLGGKDCEFYPKQVTDALMKVKGVKSVDLQSMKGHAVVSHDGTVRPEDLVAAVSVVKGEKMGVKWYCAAEVMK